MNSVSPGTGGNRPAFQSAAARSMPNDRVIAEEVGANGYLIKPIRWGSFSETVTRLLGDARAQV